MGEVTRCYFGIQDPSFGHAMSAGGGRGRSWAAWRDGSLILSGGKVFHVTQRHLHRAVRGEALTASERNHIQSSSGRKRLALTQSL